METVAVWLLVEARQRVKRSCACCSILRDICSRFIQHPLEQLRGDRTGIRASVRAFGLAEVGGPDQAIPTRTGALLTDQQALFKTSATAYLPRDVTRAWQLQDVPR